MSHFPLRNLHHRLNISKSGALRLRRNDPDWKQTVVEYDIGGVLMANDDEIESYITIKRERGAAAKLQPPVRRKRGRPRKVRIEPLQPSTT